MNLSPSMENKSTCPPKIAYVLLHFPYLTETFVAEEIRALQALGIGVRIISLMGPGPGPVQPISQQLLPFVWYAPGILSFSLWKAQIHFMSKEPGLYLDLLTTLLRQPYPTKPWVFLAKRVLVFLKAISAAYSLREDGSQLLHAHFGSLGGAATWIMSRLLQIPYTVTLVAYDIYSNYCNDLLPLLCSQASHIVTISEYNRWHLDAVVGFPSDHISVIPHGVDLARMTQSAHGGSDESDGEPIKMLSVGSLVGKKGHAHLIDACHLLRQRGLNFACTIIGGGPGEAALQRRVDAYGLQEQVKLLGARPHPEVITAYLQHDIVVLASVVTPDGDRDGIPIVLMEAGALGKPLISTEVSGIPELVRDGDTGLLVPPGDPSALAEAISSLAEDPELRACLGQNARSLVEAEFSIKQNTHRLGALFERVVQDSSSDETHVGRAHEADL